MTSVRCPAAACLFVVAGVMSAPAPVSEEALSAKLVEDVPDLQERLAALDPANPMAYFELGEDAADAASNDSELRLARHLFRLAGALDPERLGRSACLALADLEPLDTERRRLLALASLLKTRGGGMLTPDRSANRDVSISAALAVSTALGYYREGLGHQAVDALSEPGAIVALEQQEALLPRGGVTRLLEDCRAYTGGNARPKLSEHDVQRLLQLEATLLAGADRSWASELQRSGRRTLIEVDPTQLGVSLGVDVSLPYYRNGQWAARP